MRLQVLSSTSHPRKPRQEEGSGVGNHLVRKPTRLSGLAALLVTLLVTPAFGGSAGPGTLSGVHFLTGGIVIVHTSGTRTDIPSCSWPTRFAFDSTTAGGKSQLAGLMMAYAAGRQVVIYGTGACSVYGDSETISYFATVE